MSGTAAETGVPTVKILNTQAAMVREPLKAPFGFKGNRIEELWQTAARLETAGNRAVGLGVQSPLWCDARAFAALGAEGSNALMFRMTQFALNEARGAEVSSPPELLDLLLPRVMDYGRENGGGAELKTTFALNALVPVDLAAWVLFARENGLSRFEELIPPEAAGAMRFRRETLGRIPLIPYGLGAEEIRGVLAEGSFLIKIKIGSDPEHDGDPMKMLAWDKDRLLTIHRLAREIPTDFTESGRVLYYLDANGRYPSKEIFCDLLEYAEKIGALGSIALAEEPFAEESEIDVHGLPVCVAADESAHSVEDVRRRLALGYRAVALKPAAKTLSMSFRMLAEAEKAGAACFCADLTVNPFLVEWNKNVACRIRALPGLKTGVAESNGHQNYTNWDRMKTYHPCFGQPFTEAENGRYRLGEDFYRLSGGIFLDSSYYASLFRG